MSRPVPSQRTVNSWIRDFPELQFDGAEIYCNSCKKAISCKVKSNVKKHISSENHKRCVSGTTADDTQRSFNLDLMEVMVGCNIPWKKLDNPVFRQFLQKCISGQYTNVEVASESTLRKNYLSPACDNIRQRISSELNEKHLWVCVEETTNACGWKLANVFAGGLEENCSMRGHLIMSKVLDATNPIAVANLVQSSLEALWGDQYKANTDKLLLLITDPVSYMRDAGKMLKETYQNVLHITCLANGLHIVAEAIRTYYPNVDKLISSVKNVFLKAPDRVRLFHETLPHTPVPPEPNPTHSGTWLQAASYYYSNFEGVKSVVLQLNPEDSDAISQAQEAFTDPTVQKNLEYIHGHFSRITLAIHEMERKPKTSEFTIVDTLNVVFDLRQYVFQLVGDGANTVKQTLETVLNSNPGFLTMSLIVDLLNGKEVDFSTEGINVASLKKFTFFKYAPVASVDMERYFSQNRWMFDEKRQNLSPKRLEQILIIYFYSCNW